MRKKLIFLLIFGLVLLFASSHWSDAQSEETAPFMEAQAWGDSIKVMTRNIYIGADVDRILEAEDVTEIPVLALQAYQVMLSTDFNIRADALVQEIVDYKPDLIGIQEATKIFLQKPGDAIYFGTDPAMDLEYDYLDILMDKLDSALGTGYYKEAGKILNANVELPMVAPEGPFPFWDIRVEDYDVVLAKKSVDISDVDTKNFAVALEVPGTDIVVPRGYVAVTAKVKSKTYRFVNTHLEPYKINGIFPYLQRKQAQELLADLAGEDLPIILVGDFNTRAPFGLTYLLISAHGYRDVYPLKRNKGNRRGYTNPHDEDLRNTTVKFNQRIDLIFVKSKVGIGGFRIVGPVYAYVFGNKLSDRIPFPPALGGGLVWPSDHAGVIAKLRIPVR